MEIRTSPTPPKFDAEAQRNAKPIYIRDPLVIPQLFADPLGPWYRRRSGKVIIVLLALCFAGAVGVVVHYGVGGTLVRVGRVGTGLLRTFASLAGR